MANYKLAFGDKTFPSTLRPAGGDNAQDLSEIERPRGIGSIVQEGREKSRVLLVRGEMTAATADLLDAEFQSLKAACYKGTQDLYYGRDDRFYRAQVESFADDYEDGLLYGLLINVSIGFKVADVYARATSATGPIALVNGGTLAVTGDAKTQPTWTITIGAAGTGPVTLRNDTTGETCQLNITGGSFAANAVIVLTREGYSVTYNGVSTFGLLQGRIPQLAPGNNVISWTAGGSASVSSVQVSYVPRKR